MKKDFQLKVIAAMLTDYEYFKDVQNELDYNLFDEDEKRIISKLKMDYRDTGVFMNYDRLVLSLNRYQGEGKTSLLLSLQNNVKPFLNSNLDAIKSETIATIRQIKLKEKTTILSKKPNDITKKDVDELADLVSYNLEKNEEMLITDDFDILDERMYYQCIPTGFPSLDKKLGGGVRLGEGGYVLLTTYTGVGKSTFLTSIAGNAYLDGYNILHIIWEDPIKVTYRKFWTYIHNKYLFEIHNKNRNVGNYYDDNFFDNFVDYNNTASEVAKSTNLSERCREIGRRQTNTYKITKVLKERTSATDIEKDVKNFIKEYGKLDVLIIDYGDKVIDETQKNTYDYQNEFSTYAKFSNMSKKYNLALWIATQQNARGFQETGMQNIQGAIRKPQDARLVLSISKDDSNKLLGTATIKIEKQSYGESGVIFNNVLFRNDKMLVNFDEEATSKIKKTSNDGLKNN